MTSLPLIFLTSSIYFSKILKVFSSETTNKKQLLEYCPYVRRGKV